MTEESAKILLLGEFEKYFNRYSPLELNNRDKVAYIERLTRLYNCVKNDKPIEGMAATDEVIAQTLRKAEKTSDDNRLQLEFCKLELTAIRRAALFLLGLQVFTLLALIFK